MKPDKNVEALENKIRTFIQTSMTESIEQVVARVQAGLAKEVGRLTEVSGALDLANQHVNKRIDELEKEGDSDEYTKLSTRLDELNTTVSKLPKSRQGGDGPAAVPEDLLARIRALEGHYNTFKDQIAKLEARPQGEAASGTPLATPVEGEPSFSKAFSVLWRRFVPGLLLAAVVVAVMAVGAGVMVLLPDRAASSSSSSSKDTEVKENADPPPRSAFDALVDDDRFGTLHSVCETIPDCTFEKAWPKATEKQQVMMAQEAQEAIRVAAFNRADTEQKRTRCTYPGRTDGNLDRAREDHLKLQACMGNVAPKLENKGDLQRVTKALMDLIVSPAMLE